jgi:ribosomal protein S18 acetylase RimI-like enzyme
MLLKGEIIVNMVAAEEKDISFIACVCRDAKQLYDPIMPGSFERQAKRYEENGLPTFYDIRIVYDDERSRVGFEAQTNICSDINYIIGLYILYEYQRKGYGTQVLRDLLVEAKEKGNKESVLLVHNKAKWALDFYLMNGFNIVARTELEAKAYLAEMEDLYIPNTYLLSFMLVEL